MATLYLVATPIGNLEDITLRALRVLGEVDALACEDTRMTRRIFERHKINSPKTLLAYHEHNERYAGKRILDMLDSGMTVALCSDGGTPCVSDPGYRLVTECVAAGHRVEVLPGPSAVLTALLGSGLSTSSFTFKGFPPRKSGARRRFLEADLDQPHTLVVYESPFRVGKLLDDAVAVYGNRLAAVCLELTKIHEQFHRGYLADLAAQFRDLKVKGEVTVVIAGNNPKFEREEPDDESDDDSE